MTQTAEQLAIDCRCGQVEQAFHIYGKPTSQELNLGWVKGTVNCLKCVVVCSDPGSGVLSVKHRDSSDSLDERIQGIADERHSGCASRCVTEDTNVGTVAID